MTWTVPSRLASRVTRNASVKTASALSAAALSLPAAKTTVCGTTTMTGAFPYVALKSATAAAAVSPASVRSSTVSTHGSEPA